MKTTKTLIALGVSCTLGVGAAVAASTPFPVSIDDATPSKSHENSSMITWDTHVSHEIGSTSESAGGSAGDTIGSLGSESLTMDETLALADEGIYSDFYTVSMVPVTVEQWDYYVLSPMTSDDVYLISSEAGDDFYVLSPVSYDVIAFYPSSSFESASADSMSAM